MTDFHQEGIFTNLHSLYEDDDDEAYLSTLENRLEKYSRHTQIALLLPSLHSELENSTVINRIISEIKKVQYIHNIVVTLGGAREEAQFQKAKVLPELHALTWSRPRRCLCRNDPSDLL